jgi:hypothetical protein
MVESDFCGKDVNSATAIMGHDGNDRVPSNRRSPMFRLSLGRLTDI